MGIFGKMGQIHIKKNEIISLPPFQIFLSYIFHNFLSSGFFNVSTFNDDIGSKTDIWIH